MTDIETELITLIRENESPEQALITAAEIIISYLKQHGSYQEPSPVCLQESA